MNWTELNWTERLAKVWNLGNAKLQTRNCGLRFAVYLMLKVCNQGNRTSYYYYSQRRFQNDFFYIISYHCMYSLFIFHPLFNIICYCLSMRLVFIFHFQKKTASLLLTCFLIKKKKILQRCRLYTLLCQLCTLFTRSVVNIYPVVCTHHKVSCVHYLLGQL